MSLLLWVCETNELSRNDQPVVTVSLTKKLCMVRPSKIYRRPALQFLCLSVLLISDVGPGITLPFSLSLSGSNMSEIRPTGKRQRSQGPPQWWNTHRNEKELVFHPHIGETKSATARVRACADSISFFFLLYWPFSLNCCAANKKIKRKKK